MGTAREQIAILDFGSQYTKLIARALRELGAYSEIWPYDTPATELERSEVRGIVLSGGPASVYERTAPQPDPAIFSLNKPILGICYGMQLIARHFGGRVLRADKKEYGPSRLEPLHDDPLLTGLGQDEPVWMSHGDAITKLPPGFAVSARTPTAPYAVIRHESRPIWGLQFHPEVAHTPSGQRILRNFIKICDLRERWTPEDFISRKIAELQEQLEDMKCIVGVSGGVDSTTAALLVHRAIGERLFPVLIDTGLLRQGELERVQRVFARLKQRLYIIPAAERFFAALRGVTDPEEKRRRIGETFIRVFEETANGLAAEHGPIQCLVQGTIYSDVIESAGTRAARRIKSHHNVGGLPDRLDLRIIEPLRELFKDEVRDVARQLGLPEEIIEEQPFPGPGLAVRVLGEVTPERVRILQQADAIVREELGQLPAKSRPWQYFAVLLPVRSVAVLGDERGYGWIVALRAVSSRDGMTADWSKLPHALLEKISSRITNEIPAITRVVYDITSKPPGTIEWE